MLEWKPKLVLLMVALVTIAAMVGFSLGPGGYSWGLFG